MKDYVEYHKNAISEIDLKISQLKKDRANHVKSIIDLQQKNKGKIAKDLYIKKINRLTIKQDYIVGLIRLIGKECTAGDICEVMTPKLHSSKFSAKYIEAIKNDSRIVINRIHNSKFAYSLKEWNNV